MAMYRNILFIALQVIVRKGTKGVDLISSLCNIYQTSEDDLLKMIEKANTLIVGILKKTPCPASEFQTEELKNIDTDVLTYFQDLVEEISIISSIRILERDYEDAIHDRGELDEPMFVNEEDNLFGSGSVSEGAANISGVKRKYDAMSSPTKKITSPLSPPGSPLTSPVKESSTPSKIKMPPPVTPSAALMDSIWAEQRRLEALKLYYRVLAAMCRAESQRLRNSNLTSLLINERFHRCMLASSAELVLATHKTITMMFPAVLERAGIAAFDLGKLGLLAEPMPSLDTIAMHHNLTSGSLQLYSIPHKIEATS
ncbi:hypothetical protein KI387_032767, partial [Taxus chinensis]